MLKVSSCSPRWAAKPADQKEEAEDAEAKHWQPEAQFTEWDLLLSTAILATREGVMYNRFLRVLEFIWFPFLGGEKNFVPCCC
jgi:hypothetical protein